MLRSLSIAVVGASGLVGEQVLDDDGRRVDIQLKGAGETPYARRGDGRAALGPMLREYIVSEAMHALGIPRTRSLAVATTGETIVRAGPKPGAVLTRVAASHIRVGTFQYAAATGDAAVLRALADHAIVRHDQPRARAAEDVAHALETIGAGHENVIAHAHGRGGVSRLDHETDCFVTGHQRISHAGKGRHRPGPEQLFRAGRNPRMRHRNHHIARRRTHQRHRAKGEVFWARQDDGVGFHDLSP